MRESNLYNPVRNLLKDEMGCTNVYAEVANVDVVGQRDFPGGTEEIIVEMKKGLSLKLLEQAYDRIGMARYVYIAHIEPKHRGIQFNRFLDNALDRLGIGVIYVTGDGKEAYVVRNAKPLHINDRMRIKDDINPEVHTQTTGGVPTGEGPTEYSLMIDRVRAFLESRGDEWTSIAELVRHVETHYKNPKPSLTATLLMPHNSWWCESARNGAVRYFRMRKDDGQRGEV